MSKMKWFKGLFGASEDPHRRYDGGNDNEPYRLPNLFEDPKRNDDYYGSSSRATEELDRAIALSLTEEELKHKSTEGENSQTQSDEELARALQASLDLDNRPREAFDFFGPFFDGPASSAPQETPPQRSQPMCAGCNRPLGTGRFLSCMDAQWHPRCFRCTACDEPITDHEFSVQGEEPYHKRCYKELFHPKCEVCHNFIPTNRAGLIEYRSHPFWQLKYCPSHETDRTPRCGSCDRIQPRDQTYVDLDDGRKLCLECLDSVIMDTKECQPLYYNVLKFYKHLGMNIEQEIPMLLVERQALNAAREGERDGHRHTPETRGLCLSEEQIITSVYRKPSKVRGSKPFMVRTESQKLVRHCEVTAILVLYGLPRLLTGSILAHELMHAWLRLDGRFPTLASEVEEGICQVMAHMWLLSQTGFSSSSTSDDLKRGNQVDQLRLGEFFRHQIAHDPSPVYGGGFRAGQIAVGRYGLPQTLEHMKMTGTFPL
ncbi:hypothetical protein MPTK1_8g01060 [Marchantia polymorpha subsp. ruderalis]|uniref:LIM zinc-binding domain-containing protein n=1 Tax=Marchantia polymorpha TaxID=3197 RepID=A0A2R6WRC7_MARPO|nr:hypothetical protein MARPO_0064s0092 [Marchantia polymorpha]BBN18258.1 hypothetical protein Mp_8g01060 [Marchantia polymorpha subsp. ruderalis]|eukprot:PTQ36415.1 hypothetical protein MARPO_0064s0092 [Marchantia polymorpha]